MKKTNKFFGTIALLAITGLFLTGCCTLFSIRVESNLSSVRPGGTIRFNAPGKNIIWKVSSTDDGFGSVTEGTYITPGGVLTVSINETKTTLYIIATSADKGRSEGRTDIKQVRVTTVTGVTINSQSQSVRIGRTLQFNAVVAGSNNPDNKVSWKVSSNADGTETVPSLTRINSSGLLTVAADESLSTLYVSATSVVDPSKSGSAAVTVLFPTVTSVIVNPSNQSIIAGRTLQFEAAVTGTNDPDKTVTWKVSSNAAGTGAVTQGTTINTNGLLTVAAAESLSTLYVIATSTMDTTMSGSVSVNILIPIITGVTVSSSSYSITSGTAVQFYATVMGTFVPDNTVIWKVSSNAAGTGAVTQGTKIDTNGILTVAANETATALYVFAASAADPAKFGSSIISVILSSEQTQSRGQNRNNQNRGRNRNPAAATPTVPPVAAPPATPVVPPTVTPPATPAVPPTVTPPATPVVPPTVTPPATPVVTSVSISPSGYSTRTNSTVQFSATVSGTNNPGSAVTWSVSSNAAGTGAVAPGTRINANGLLNVAPNEWATTLYVFAVSTADPSKSGTATVTIINNNQNQGSNQGQAHR